MLPLTHARPIRNKTPFTLFATLDVSVKMATSTEVVFERLLVTLMEVLKMLGQRCGPADLLGAGYEIGVLEDIECFRAELQLQRFTDRKIPPDSHVHLPSPKTPRKVPRRIAETRAHVNKG